MQTLTFQNITLTPAKVDNQIWLTSADLAKALGYSQENAVTKIYSRNTDEFTSGMTTVIETMTNGINNSQRKIKIRIFSLRGCHLIAMFARTDVAKAFRQWVLDILDKEVGAPTICPEISEGEAYQLNKAIKARCGGNKAHYQALYHALYERFSVTSYKRIAAADYQAAIDFVADFRFHHVGDKQLYETLSRAAISLIDYARTLRTLRALPMSDDKALRWHYDRARDAANDIAAYARAHDLRNARGEPMFGNKTLHYYDGVTVTFG